MAELTFATLTIQTIERHGEYWLTINDIAAALYPYENKGGYKLTPPLRNG